MRKYIIFFFGLILFLFFPTAADAPKQIPVFQVSQKPSIITRGSHGSALTANISFGDMPIYEWIHQLKKPYPLLFIDIDWAQRFPATTELMIDKGIPIGLLGKNGKHYVETDLLEQHIQAFETTFTIKPLWFRTADEYFPDTMVTYLYQEEINILSSTHHWTGKHLPTHTPGEIIAVSFTQDQPFDLEVYNNLVKERKWKPIEEVLFNISTQQKKFPPN